MGNIQNSNNIDLDNLKSTPIVNVKKLNENIKGKVVEEYYSKSEQSENWKNKIDNSIRVKNKVETNVIKKRGTTNVINF